MNIYGEKIFLRALEERDNAMLREMMNDPETERLVCGASWPVSESGQKQWLANLRNDPNMLRCAVQCIESGESVGTVILSDIDRHSGTAELISSWLPPAGARATAPTASRLSPPMPSGSCGSTASMPIS